MPDRIKRRLLGGVIALALAAAVSYGLISQQTADTVQTRADQAIAEGESPPPAGQQPAPSEPRTPDSPAEPTTGPAPQTPSATPAR